jgi:hypothetical protein
MYKFPFILWSIIKGNIFKKQTNKFDIGSNLFHFQKFMSGWWQTRDQITPKGKVQFNSFIFTDNQYCSRLFNIIWLIQWITVISKHNGKMYVPQLVHFSQKVCKFIILILYIISDMAFYQVIFHLPMIHFSDWHSRM